MYSYSGPLQIQTYFFDVFSLIHSIKIFIIAGYLFSYYFLGFIIRLIH